MKLAPVLPSRPQSPRPLPPRILPAPGRRAADPRIARAGAAAGGHQGPGTRKMAARLAAIARDINPDDDLFLSRRRARAWNPG